MPASNVRLGDDLHKRLQKASHLTGVSQAHIIRRAVEHWLNGGKVGHLVGAPKEVRGG